jgi:hypothetical protein
MQKEWVLSLRDQCRQANVPFFFKQWGGVRKSAAGRDLDGRTYDELPPRVQFPAMEHGRRLAAIAEILAAYPPATSHSQPCEASVSAEAARQRLTPTPP